jgi:IS5 family transposase
MQNPKNEAGQEYFFKDRLENILNPKHPLCQLAKKILWESLEKEFAKYYRNFGRPAKPTRLMISLLLLKQIYDQGDETAVEAWVQNPYWQYFSGEDTFQWEKPCDPSDLVHFRKRIGPKGMEKIFQISIDLHKEKVSKEKAVVVDTTVQEKNITYPTDTKLARKIAEQCVGIARQEGLKLRRSYSRTIPRLVFAQRGRNHPRGMKRAAKATDQLKTIAGRLVRELNRKLSSALKEQYREQLELFQKVLDQKRGDKNKIYSLHEPQTYCISKGKVPKKFEFGSKSSFAMTEESGIIVGAFNMEENQYDGKTLPRVLDDVRQRLGRCPSTVIVDQGYRGRKKIDETEIVSADKLRKELTRYEKRKTKKQLRRRAAIEPVIGHLKSDFRLARNYLKGVIGDQMNVLLAATAFNLKKWLNRISQIK